MDIGLELKQLRKKFNLTQSQLAEKCGLSKNAIWNYENNKRTPPFSTLNRISNELGVDLGYLLTSPIVLTSDTAKSLESSGVGKILECSKLDEDPPIEHFKNFLASAEFPHDIPLEDIELLLDKTIDFLNYEFFKLGYLKFDDNNTNNLENITKLIMNNKD